MTTYLLRQERPRLPQFGKKLVVQRVFQIRCAGSSAGPYAHADYPLHELNVPEPPAHHQFVEFGESFAYVNPITIAAFISVEGEDGTGPGIKFLTLGRTVNGLQLAHRVQCVKENIVQRRLTQSPLDQGVSLRSRPVIAQHLLVLQSAQELQFAELF